MGYQLTHTLKVKIGEYQKGGETKARYRDVGRVMTDENGKELILIETTFNPAGVPNPRGDDSIVVSKFAVEPKGSGQKLNTQPPARSAPIPEDEMPF